MRTADRRSGVASHVDGYAARALIWALILLLPGAEASGQRAATSIGRPYGHDQIARMRARSATLAAAGVAAQPQKRVARNPHGLSMSQRVAALQIGRPATYVHSTM